MKHLEEKILAYLDGSLGESEREQVLREVSASWEGRRMLEEHLRVGSLLTQAAKPTSAPLDAQRALAEKLPMMATYLPYLAAQPSRKAAAVWYRSTKYITAIAGGAALVGGALWFTLSSPNNSGESQNLPVAAEHNIVTPQTTHPQANSQPAESNTKWSQVSKSELNGSHTPNGLHSVASNTVNSSSARSFDITSANHAESHAPTIVEHRTIDALAHQEISHKATAHNIVVANHDVETISNRATNLQAVQASGPKPVEQASTPKPQTNSEAIEPLAIPLHGLNVSNAAAQRDTHYEIPRFIAARQSAGYIPLRGFVNFKQRYASLTTIAATPYTIAADSGVQTSDVSTALEAELAYEVTPWLSVGLRGGRSTFYQLQDYYYTLNSGDLVHTYRDAFLSAVPAPWIGLSVRYEFNPQDDLRFAATGVGGAAFVPASTSPIGLLELSGAYSLWSFLALEAGASVDASSVRAAGAEAPKRQYNTVGYITTGPTRSTITTTSFGGRIGLVFHP